MEPARTVGRGFFPLDEQLGLDGAGVTPRGQEALVRLAVWMPFERACELLRDVLGIQISATSARRSTYQIGVTVLFRENPTLRDGMASQAALSTHDEERGNQGNAFCMHLLLLK
jgi:hypothetical protein